MKVRNAAEEPIYLDHYDPEALANILETQRKITNVLKKRGDEQLFQILIVIDDFADDPSFTRQPKLPHAHPRAPQHNFDDNSDAKVQRHSPYHAGQCDRALCLPLAKPQRLRHLRR